MSNFNERLARLADAARLLSDGQHISHELMILASDIDGELERQRADWYQKRMDLFTAWNDFLNSSVEDASRYGKGQLMFERRRMARIVAADPRWTGGYADALALLEEKREA